MDGTGGQDAVSLCDVFLIANWTKARLERRVEADEVSGISLW